MKMFSATLFFFGFCSILVADTIFLCTANDSEMMFTTSNIIGQPIFSYQNNNEEEEFQLIGDELQIEDLPGGLIVSGQLPHNPRFSSFVATFPVIAPHIELVTASLRLNDRFGMPFISPPYECTVMRVQS